MEKVTPLPVTIEKAVGLIKDAFIGAAERETSTGDGVVIRIITSKGMKDEIMGLRKD
jgi:20S proteasome subunit beta 6